MCSLSTADTRLRWWGTIFKKQFKNLFASPSLYSHRIWDVRKCACFCFFFISRVHKTAKCQTKSLLREWERESGFFWMILGAFIIQSWSGTFDVFEGIFVFWVVCDGAYGWKVLNRGRLWGMGEVDMIFIVQNLSILWEKSEILNQL